MPKSRKICVLPCLSIRCQVEHPMHSSPEIDIGVSQGSSSDLEGSMPYLSKCVRLHPASIPLAMGLVASK